MEPSVVDLKEATLYIQDGAGTPNKLEIKMDEGNITWTETKNREYRLNRGVLDTVRNGDQEPMAISFEGRFSAITAYGGDNPTISEALKKTGQAASWVSTGAACEPYAVDIIVEVDRACATGTNMDEVITFPDFRYEEIGGDFEAGQISVSGKCNAEGPTGVRTTLV